MDNLWLRLSAVLVLWLIASLVLFEATLQFPYFFISGWFYAACAACGILGLFIGKLDRVASLIAVPVLAVASLVVVSVLRLGYFGL